MSKGIIKKPKSPSLPENLSKQPLEDIIYHVTQTCEVEVDDSEWSKAFDEVSKKIRVHNEEQKTRIDSLMGKLEAVEKALEENPFEASKFLNDARAEIEALKRQKPIATSDEKEEQAKELRHKKFEILYQILLNKLNIYLVGPSGAGKTYVAEQCARELNVPFHFTGAVASEFKLTGFVDAQGRIVSTEFRKAYEYGGLFLFDEIDGSYPQAVLAFNAALANDYMDFPDRRVTRHKDFYCIAAANTFGQGADRQYVGRNQLDAASLDRFVFLEWNYDENLESKLASNLSWTKHVQSIRKFVHENKIRHVVSPRASIFGSKLLASGLTKSVVEELVLWKGMDEATKSKIKEAIKPRAIVHSEFDGDLEVKTKLKATVKTGDVIAKVGDYYNKKEIKAPCDGTIVKVSRKRTVTKGDELAIIKK